MLRRLPGCAPERNQIPSALRRYEVSKNIGLPVVGSHLVQGRLRCVPAVEHFFDSIFVRIDPETDRPLIRFISGVTLDLHLHIQIIKCQQGIRSGEKFTFSSTVCGIFSRPDIPVLTSQPLIHEATAISSILSAAAAVVSLLQPFASNRVTYSSGIKSRSSILI